MVIVKSFPGCSDVQARFGADDVKTRRRLPRPAFPPRFVLPCSEQALPPCGSRERREAVSSAAPTRVGLPFQEASGCKAPAGKAGSEGWEHQRPLSPRSQSPFRLPSAP